VILAECADQVPERLLVHRPILANRSSGAVHSASARPGGSGATAGRLFDASRYITRLYKSVI
jgi:hypothetical protein